MTQGGTRSPYRVDFDVMRPELVAAYDELPLWSAPFGLALLEHVPLRAGMAVLDIGCGTGFPLLELAQRLGRTCAVHGVDPWRAALDRCRQKGAQYDVTNVRVVEGVAERLPYPAGAFDLIVSNNGLNNVADQAAALAECFRVAASPADVVLTMNLPDTMRELYDVFGALLAELRHERELARMHEQIAAMRKPRAVTEAALRGAGFEVRRVEEHAFSLRFADGRALLDHYFIRLAFLPGWIGVVAPRDAADVLAALQRRLDDRATAQGALRLTVPFACYVCAKR